MEATKTGLEHKILVALTAKTITQGIRDLGRENGAVLKAMGIDVKDFQLKVLDLVGEAYTLLKEEAKKAENK